MAKDGNHMTERILNLTLEIVYLLTGENYVAFKLSDGLVASNVKKTKKAILEPSSHSSKKKMQEVTTEMIELLTGEDVTDYFSVEEEEYLEDQKDLLMRNEPLLTSHDGSRNLNPPKRLAGPPYILDSTHKADKSPQDYQAENIFKVQVELTEDGEEPYVGGDVPSEEEEMDPQVSTDPSDTKGTQTSIKVEQDIIAVKIKEEEIHSEIGTDGQYYRSNISHDGDGEDDITSNSPGENPIASNLYPILHHIDLSSNLSAHRGRFPIHTHPITHRILHTGGDRFFRSELGECFTQGVDVLTQQKPEIEKPYLCPICGKCFSWKAEINRHLRIHTGEKPFSCIECGKSFAVKSNLDKHRIIHSGEKPFACSDCGRCFSRRSYLISHQMTHTGEKPYSCTECGKRFAERSNLDRHQRTHSGEKPFSCSECGKSFSRRAHLISHQITHTR